jgi:MFS family permease
MYWAINLGAALAPIIAGLMAHINYLLLFVGDALTTAVYGILVLWRVHETQPAEAVHAARVPISGRLNQLAREPILLAFSLLTLLFGLVYMQAFVTLPLDMQQHGLGPSGYGIASAANGILIVLITIQLSSRIAKWPPLVAMAGAAVLLGIGFGANAWAASLPGFTAAVIIWTFGEIIGAAVSPTIIANLAAPELRGLYQGIYGSAWGLAFFIGPVLGGWIFERYSPDTLWYACAIAGAALAIGYIALSRPAHARLKRP